jgi:predicted Rossmann fold nucleotide-binding protein DprA/Smf involved in DNA uptake
MPDSQHDVKRRILRFLETPRHVSEVAAHIGRPGSYTSSYLCILLRQGLVQRVERGTYRTAGDTPARRNGHDRRVGRDRILALLSEPRRREEIVRLCPGDRQDVLKDLAALIRGGHAQRGRDGAYRKLDVARPPRSRQQTLADRERILAVMRDGLDCRDIAALCGQRVRQTAFDLAALVRGRYLDRVGGRYYRRDTAARLREDTMTDRERIVVFLTEPRTLEQIAAHCGKRRGTAVNELVALVRAGRIRRIRPGVYALPDAAENESG